MLKALGLLLVSVLYFSTAANNLGDWAGDAAHYILLGQSLAEGQGYVDSMIPGSPTHTRYPFLFPALLAPVIRVLGINFLAIRIEVILIAIAAIVSWYYYFRTRLSPASALLLTILLAIQPYSIVFLTRTLSETPFLLWTGITFFALSRWRESGNNSYLFIMVAAAILAYFTRTAAISLFAALIFTFIVLPDLRKRKVWRLPAYLAVAFLLTLAFAAWTGHVLINGGSMHSYFWELSHSLPGTDSGEAIGAAKLISRVKINAAYYFFQVPRDLLVFLKGRSIPASIGCLLFWLLMASGAVRSWRTGEQTEVLYAIFTIAMILLWPGYLDFRFLYPLLPVFVLFGYRGIEAAGDRLPGRNLKRTPGLAAASLLIVVYVISTALIVRAQHTPRPYPPYSEEVFGHYIEGPVIDCSKTAYVLNTPQSNSILGEYIVLHVIAKKILVEEAVFAGSEPQNAALFLGRQTVPLPLTVDHKAALEYFSSWNVRYVIVDRFSRNTEIFTVPLVREYPQYFTKVIGNPNRISPAIYRFDYPKLPEKAGPK